MTKKIKYRATFSDGTVITRSSHRVYTHAWMRRSEKITEKRRENDYPLGDGYTVDGFSGSEALARNALGPETSRDGVNWKTLIAEVVPVEVVP